MKLKNQQYHCEVCGGENSGCNPTECLVTLNQNIN